MLVFMNTILAIILIATAGPLIGSFIGVIKRPSPGFMYNFLSFAAGVMLAISFLELIPQSIIVSSIWICVIGIIGGALVMLGVDKIIPHLHPGLGGQEHGKSLRRVAIYLLTGIFLHHFPEGIAMGIGLLTDIKHTFIIALAIAIHDIPEGICTSAPYYYATKKRLKAFLLSLSTAVPSIFGFLFAYYFFSILPIWIVGFLTAATAGIMVYISADELIPVSCSKMTNHSTIFSLILGVLLVILLGLI